MPKRVLIFTRYGKTRSDAIGSLRKQGYQIAQVEKVAGDRKNGLQGWRVYAVEDHGA